MQINHISASRVNTYNRCGMQYYFRYVERLIKPPSAALTLGASFHETTATNYRQKIETHADLPLPDVLEVFAAEMDQRIPETDWQDADPGQTKDSGIQLVEKYYNVVAVPTQPLEVEQKFELSFKNRDYLFVGIVDLIDAKRIIRETKTTSRTPSSPRDEHVLQSVAYATGYRAKTKQKEAGIQIDYAVRSFFKAEPMIVSFTVEAAKEQIMFFLGLMDRTVRGIEQEVWIPRRDSFLCSRRWCGYWNECEKACWGRVKD